ncbi:putative polarized growth protein (Boi2) [Aspergillus clavatus NRRL 1]|uniref:Polarized growth protein Boi2, putative n=1 Tax=Aspergillus clavatus (strain ATCC 1007 / CBS 513.65 / DSM 816 / NCTC 3887 / NRRL 1 / QM 1276 / 107) TaxID=344612 RepID=A1CEX0_ASPCL|nr:polarized growth protein Boi2, putative [Aspergillus clavatus NRRL 1]EAW11419.1 polarized growth protein Boi2, putative [Aspergillus clavatus NRRL 1]
MALSTPPRGVRPGDFLLVVHDFDARGTDELTLRRGEKIELVELDEGFGDGWYLGKDLKTGTTGLFPGVYTTAAPKIPIRPAREDEVDMDGSKIDGDEGLDQNPIAAEAVTSPLSGETTPQASRHTSASDIQVPDLATDLDSMQFSPKQQQRSSSSPLPTSKLAVDIQQSIRQTLDGRLNGQDSPVMNETLSVIDEHITDLSTPRHSVIPPEQKVNNDSSSEYSNHLDHRVSYIRGHETDEEEENQPTEAEVRSWNAAETSKHLRELGVEEKHCDIFQEQEITGDVLLDMDQDFLFMKEFDFGVMGRRLKTWHKVKAFQEEVRDIRQQSQQGRGSASSYPASSEERSLSRASHAGPFLPRIPHLSRGSAGSMQHPRLMSSGGPSNTTSLTSQTPSFMDHMRRPSAASIRDINHHRRHSSIDASHRMSTVMDPASHFGHVKQPSFDRAWTMTSGQKMPSRSSTLNEGILPQHAFRRPDTNESDSATSISDRHDELERGYFSGPEGDNTKSRRLLQKRTSVAGSASHSRKPSYADEHLTVNKRHSRVGSVDSIREVAKATPDAISAPVTSSPKGRFRSLSTRVIDRRGQSSQTSNTTAATDKPSASPGFFASFSPLAPFVNRSDTDGSTRSSKSTGAKIRRAAGLRAISDVVGKGIDTSVAPGSPIRDTDPTSARTGSTTPSTSKSSERHSTESSVKNAEGGISFPRPRASVKSGPKSKKDTSAYMRGLEKKSPQEQMEGCDFSGWMKKRSSNLMTTWKPRLFVLRGRRLSYYYSENDTEERGLIDITAHRVLRADNDPIVALHATITGATGSPTSPSHSNGIDIPAADRSSKSSPSGTKVVGEGPFFFKLVPPKTTRTVQFTKPAVHYFQVDSVKEGRLWMAALMKATIDRDMSLPVETTNKQKTISLKQARMMSQRPPALMTATDMQEQREEVKSDPPSTGTEERGGLRIKGLFDNAPVDDDEYREDNASLNSLGDIDAGPPSLLPESLVVKSDH